MRRYFSLWFVGIFLSSWLGAKILFWAVQELSVQQNLWQESSFWLGGGFVFYGGLLFAMFYIALIGHFFPSYHYSKLGFCLIPLLIGHAVGRIGCFFAGCCYGMESSWGMEVHGHERVPLPLFESIYLLLLALILSKRTFKSPFSFYLLTYGIGRFVLEFFRGDVERGIWGGLSTSQWISLVLVLVGIILMMKKDQKTKA
jgi:phosphatidylglycerol:prolipoprotein diacylglycerol transferase